MAWAEAESAVSKHFCPLRQYKDDDDDEDELYSSEYTNHEAEEEEEEEEDEFEFNLDRNCEIRWWNSWDKIYLYFTHFALRISFSISSNATRFFSSASSLKHETDEREISEPSTFEVLFSPTIVLLLLHEKLDDDELEEEEEDDEFEDLPSCWAEKLAKQTARARTRKYFIFFAKN